MKPGRVQGWKCGVKTIAVDSSGNIYVVGESMANWDWAPPLNAHAGEGDVFVAKLDSGGTLMWHTFLGGTGVDKTNGVVVDVSDNIQKMTLSSILSII